MSILELNELVKGKTTDEEQKTPHVPITKEDLDDFTDLLKMNENYTKALFITEDSKEFFESATMLNDILDSDKKEDLFYAVRAGFFFEGVPAKLTYILSKALNKHKTPNLALSSIDNRLLLKYFKKNALPEGVTVKSIIENILGYEIELISKYKKKVTHAEDTEVYVENVDRIVIVDSEISDKLTSREDLNNISYVKGVGVSLYDKPLRIITGKIGVIYDEYDLRNIKC